MSATPLELLLSRLDGVRRTGEGRFISRCPAHGDKHPSLAIRETADAVLLLHCFAGCDVEGVVAAIGLDIADLFPQQPGRYRRPERRPFSAGDLLSLAAWESLIASLISGDIARGKPDADRQRLLQAAGRLLHIAEVANVR
jgi:hypothetical protein